MLEKPKSPERKEVTDQEIGDALRFKGVEDPEVSKLLRQWTEQEEKKVANNPRAAIEFNRKKAKIYLEAGCKDDALDSLECARTQAWNENRTDLYEEITAEMDKIESES